MTIYKARFCKYVFDHNKVHSYPFVLNKKVIFFQTKDNRILLFLVEHYTIKTDIIKYYSLLKSFALKLCDEK